MQCSTLYLYHYSYVLHLPKHLNNIMSIETFNIFAKMMSWITQVAIKISLLMQSNKPGKSISNVFIV